MKKVLLILILLFSGKSLLAQNDDSTYKYWMTGGFWLQKYLKGSVTLSYQFSLENYFYKVGYLVNGAAKLDGGFTTNADGFLFRSVNISIGDRLEDRYYQIATFIGPAFVFGEERNNKNELENFSTVGLQVDAQFVFKPVSEIGLGLGLYSNLNFKQSFYGMNVLINIGNGK
jgi:hypothetical protein